MKKRILLFIRRRWRPVLAVLFLLGVLIISGSLYASAAMFDDYEVNQGNDLVVYVDQKQYTGKSNADAARYATDQWYMFSESTYYSHNLWNLDKWEESTFNLGTKVTLTTVSSTTPDSDGMYTQTRKIEAEELVPKVLKMYKREELLKPQGVVVYFAPTIRCTWYTKSETIRKQEIVYSYQEFVDFLASVHLSWSSGAKTAVSGMYETPLTLYFNCADFTIRFVEIDENGNETGKEIEGFSFNGADAYGGKVIYGEPLTFSSGLTGSSQKYDYVGYRWGDGSINSSRTPADITVDRTVAPNEELVLNFCFEKKAEPTSLPFLSPTPGATYGPTPTPTKVPDPATPTPTPQPTEDLEVRYLYEYYFTTDAGYWIGKIADSTTYQLANENTSYSGGVIKNAAYTTRTNAYLKGMDSVGNTWYFIAEGTDATYVHPAVYNGYAVESSNVKYITELVFPSTITYGGTQYNVRSIGGGTAMYKTVSINVDNPEGSWNSTTGYGYEKYHNYGIISGYYYYNRQSGGSGYTSSEGCQISYTYGVIGNGEIQSYGDRSKFYQTTGAQEYRPNANDYYVYNTTLRKVTIPDTVTTILPYAFEYCQALEEIKGGEGITSIDAYAFAVEDHPEKLLRLSNEWVEQSYKNYDYSYYNESYSLDSYTAVMLDWRNASFLSDHMEFPFLPSLKVLNTESFARHYNIDEVDLSETVETIGVGAFLDCKLNHIRIPNASVVIGSTSKLNAETLRAVLGTKGRGDDPTGIHTVPESTAMKYGMKFDGYYRVYCGYPVTYEPNGAQGEAVEVYGALNINYLETDSYYSYQNYEKSYSGSWYKPAGYSYRFHVDETGHLWSIDTEENRAVQVFPETVFTEIINVGRGTAYYAWDADGNLWFSGQREYKNQDSDGSWYSAYSGMHDWKKLTLPGTVADIQFSPRGVYILDTDGTLWNLYPDTGYYYALTKNGPALTSFYVLPYYENMYVCGTDADGTVWKRITDSGVWQVFTNSVKARGTYLDVGGSSVVVVVIGEDGNLYMDYYNRSNVTLGNAVYSGGNFVRAELAMADDHTTTGYVHVPLLYDASGCVWLANCFYYSGLKVGAVRITSSADTGVKELWTHSVTYGEYWATDDSSETEQEERIYAWTEDGYITAIAESYSWRYGWSMSDTRFVKVSHYYGNVYAIAEDGTLWSAGTNEYGQLGHTTDNNYQYPSSPTSRYLKQTGTQTYTDIYAADGYALAMGTDGTIYFAGRSTNYAGITSNGNYSRFVSADNEPEWPTGKGVLKVIRGYDYDTVIAYNLFQYPDYNFIGWNTAADGSGAEYQPGDLVDLDSNLILYAQWETAKNRIVYRSNGGRGYMTDTILEADVTNTYLQKNSFTNPGYTFAGWNTAADGSGTAYQDGAYISYIKGTVVLYAQWEYDPIEYTVKFANEIRELHTGYLSVHKLTYGDSLTIPGEPFSKSYTVSYDLNKKTSMSTTPTMTTVLTEEHTKAAFSFAGWRLYREQEGVFTYLGRKYQEGVTVSNLTSIADDVLVMFPEWGGTASYVTLPMVECEGYELYGWTLSATVINDDNVILMDDSGESEPIYQPTGNQKLYAYYKPKEYLVTLDGQKATVQEQETVVMLFDRAATRISVPQKEDFVFRGYYTEIDGEGTMVYDSNGIGQVIWNGDYPENIHVLYAYWTKKEMTSAEINLFSIDPTYIVEANLYEEEGLPTLEWREYGDTMLELSVKTLGYFDYAIVNAPWEKEQRKFTWEDGTYTKEDDTWIKNENVVFWRSQLKYPEEEDKVREYPGYHNQTYTILVSFYIDDKVVKEYKVGLYMVPWLTWREEIHPSREGGSWDFNGDGIPDRWIFNNGKK